MRPRLATQTFLHIALAIGAVSMILPFLWMLSTSLKPESEIFTFPPTWLPHVWKWGNYSGAMEAAPFGRYFLNTVIYAGLVTFLNLLLCSLAAYAFARLEFRGKGPLFVLVLGTMMVPGQVTMVPVFVMLKHWPLLGGNDLLGAGGHGLLNSYTGLILPATSKDSMKTLQVGLQVFQTQYTTRWDLLMAGTVIVTIPVLIIFLAGQRYFTRGIAMSGMKG
jgi:multiple sugar transport system permease protein